MPRKSKATTQYQIAHRLVFFSEYDRDLKICAGEQVTVPSGSLVTVIDGRRERPVCQADVFGKTAYGYIWADHHEPIEKGGHDDR
jgi:hypothetical protein